MKWRIVGVAAFLIGAIFGLSIMASNVFPGLAEYAGRLFGGILFFGMVILAGDFFWHELKDYFKNKIK